MAEEDRDLLRATLHKKFAEWHRIQKSTGLTFTASLLAKRDFHNPNMAEFLSRLGGLDEYGSSLPEGYGRAVFGERDGEGKLEVPDFEQVGKEQRAEWERRQQQPANHRTAIPFVPAAVGKPAEKQTSSASSYAALLQERRSQQN